MLPLYLDSAPGLGKAFEDLVDIYVANRNLQSEELFEALSNPEPLEVCKKPERMREFELAGIQYQFSLSRRRQIMTPLMLRLLGESYGVRSMQACGRRPPNTFVCCRKLKEPTGRRYLNSGCTG